MKLPGLPTIAALMLTAVLSAWIAIWGPLIATWSANWLLILCAVALVGFASITIFLAPEKWIELLNLTVVAAALIAAGFAAYWSYRQAESADHQARAAQDQNKLAQEQNRLAQDIGRRQVKAYVIFSEATLSYSTDKRSYFLEVRVRNSGTTPAFNMVHVWHAEVQRRSSVAPVLFECGRKVLESYDLAGGTDIPLGDHRRYSLEEGEYEAIKAGELAIVVSGCVDYADSFQRARQQGIFRLINGYTPDRASQAEEVSKMRLLFHSMSDR